MHSKEDEFNFSPLHQSAVNEVILQKRKLIFKRKLNENSFQINTTLSQQFNFGQWDWDFSFFFRCEWMRSCELINNNNNTEPFLINCFNPIQFIWDFFLFWNGKRFATETLQIVWFHWQNNKITNRWWSMKWRKKHNRCCTRTRLNYMLHWNVLTFNEKEGENKNTLKHMHLKLTKSCKMRYFICLHKNKN